MTRIRHKKSHNNTQLPALQQQMPKTSPAAQIVRSRIENGGVEYLMQNAIRIMTASRKLAEEPEFIDFNMDGEKAVTVSLRWEKKYEKRLSEAKMKGLDEFQVVYDEMRIEAIIELATPAFREDVDRRLRTMLDRLMASDDLENLEIVLLLKPLLGMRMDSWGVCGLILAIYHRSLQKIVQKHKAEIDLFDELVDGLQADREEIIDITKPIKMPEKFEQLAKRLFTAKPGLLERVEKQVLDMVATFEKELAGGKIALDLFTQEELLLSFQRLQAVIGKPVTQVQPSAEMSQLVFDSIIQTINEIMTPERFRRLRKDVQSMEQDWLRKREKWAAALQAELIWLDGKQYKENKFVVAALLGQIARSGSDSKQAQKQKKRSG